MNILKSFFAFSILTLFSFQAYAEESAAAQTEMPTKKSVLVKIETNMGDILLELDQEKAPQTVENFVRYVEEKFYAGTIFHRVIDGFMIQAGGYTADYEEKETHPTIQNEADNGLENLRGTIAMARTAVPHSAAAQFFINTVDNKRLNHRSKSRVGWGYAVFGKVIEGMDVVDKIQSLETGRGGSFYSDVPQTPVIIEAATLVDTAQP